MHPTLRSCQSKRDPAPVLSLSGESPANLMHSSLLCPPPASPLTKLNMKNNVSPAKKLRSLRRLLNHYKNKTLENKPKLGIKILPSIIYSPKVPILSISEITCVDISPALIESSHTDPSMIAPRMNNPTNHQTVPSSHSLDDVYAPGEYERNRENVQNTLRLIDAALNYGR